MTLTEIAIKHGTAKVGQGFMPLYEKILEPLRGMDICLLEIGIAEGASLRTWREYFPKAYIWGLDKVVMCEVAGCIIAEGDASETGVLVGKLGINTEVPLFDIIIDDASHRASEQLMTFDNLWPKVLPGGWYVVEDLFTLYDPVWNPSGPNIIDELYARMQDILTGSDEISELHFHANGKTDGIVFIRKR